MATSKGDGDSRLNVRIDPELKAWALDYVSRKGTDLSKMVIRYLKHVRQKDDELLAADAEQL